MSDDELSKKLIKYGTKKRVTDYLDEDSVDRIYLEGLLREGYSIEIISKKMGINPTTFYRWLTTNTMFASIVRNAREVVDFEVENSLKKNCTGYYVDRTIVDKEGNEHKVKEWIPASVEAQKFWLKNKKSANWRDKQEITDTTAIEILKDILIGLKTNACNDVSVEAEVTTDEENKI